MKNEYLEMNICGEKTLIKRESVRTLKGIDTIIFDCDGVLIDVRESYNRTIIETVNYVFQELFGATPLDQSFLREIIFLFRKSGGFNIDWDTAYAILMIILSKSSENLQKNLLEYTEEIMFEKNLFKRFLFVKNRLRKEYELTDTSSSLFDANLVDHLNQFAGEADSSGIVNLESKIIDSQDTTKDFIKGMKAFLSYPGEVGISLLTTIFEEIFCGSTLFEKIYKQQTHFWYETGLINNEKIILKPDTLDKLSYILSGLKIGIASGRSIDLARHSLKDLIKRFDPKSLFFYETIDAAEQNLLKEKKKEVNLKKPNPFSLITLARLNESRSLLYVGDSMEDLMMVREANNVNSQFSFAGVFAHSEYQDRFLRSFIRDGAELIIPSVNELPEIMTNILELT
jgi:phosphoglycolate phosphatase-like HAD superfamily hydrolase